GLDGPWVVQHVDAVERHRSRGRPLEGFHDLEGGRLARAIRSQDAEHLAPVNVKGNSVHRDDGAEMLAERVDPDKWVAHLAVTVDRSARLAYRAGPRSPTAAGSAGCCPAARARAPTSPRCG